MKQLFLLATTTLFFFSLASAQNGFLRGRVIDKEVGEGLIGTNIYVEGTTTGTIADFNGNYSLPWHSAHIILYSHLFLMLP